MSETPTYGTLKKWSDAGTKLLNEGTGHQFSIADWLLAGEEEFGEICYGEAEAITGFARQTLYDYVHVAREFPPSHRDYDRATFNHYRAALGFPDERTRDHWLSQASAYTVADFRRLVAEKYTVKIDDTKTVRVTKPGKPLPALLSIRLEKAEKKVLMALASLRGVEITDIVRPLLIEYLAKPELREEALRAVAQAQSLAREQCEAREKEWIRATKKSFQDVLNLYLDEAGEGAVEWPSQLEFRERWERLTGRKFTMQVFNFAMEHNVFSSVYYFPHPEHFGLPKPIVKSKYKSKKIPKLKPRKERSPSLFEVRGPFMPNLKDGDTVYVSGGGETFTDTVKKVGKKYIILKLEGRPSWNKKFYRKTGDNIKSAFIHIEEEQSLNLLSRMSVEDRPPDQSAAAH